MNCRILQLFRRLLKAFCILPVCGFVFAQTSSGPINIDQALREEAPLEPDRAASYYHYALAKWYESRGDQVRALFEMRTALEYNPASSAIHYELAVVYARQGNIAEATRYANESIKLDAENPDPHWLLMNIHMNSQQVRRRGGDASVGNDGLRQAVQELEIIEKQTPDDERVYFTLGEVYLQLGEIDKAIDAFEKYQKYADSDNGWREIAQYYASVNNLEKAAEYLKKGLAFQPDSVASLMLLGNIYLNQGKTREAAEVFKKFFAISSGNAPMMRELAVILFEAKDYRETAEILEEMVRTTGPNRELQVLLGRSYLEMNRYSDAIRIFHEVLERVPGDVEARFNLGEAYVNTGRYEDAAKLYEDLLQVWDNPLALGNRAVFLERLAGVWLALENYEKAIALFEEIVAATPKDSYKLMEAYRVSKKYDKGIAFGKEYLEKNPDDIFVNIIYARTLADAGKKREGAEFLSKLLQSHPNNIEIYINLSEIYRQDKRYSDAEKVLMNGEERNKNPEAVERMKFQRAAVYEQQKLFDHAEQLFKEILDKRPDNASALNYLGYMLADRGVRLDEAIRYINKALEIDPQNGAYLDSLGWAYFKQDDMENAEKYLVQAVSVYPNDSTIHDHLGDLYFKTGQLEKARDCWTEAIRISNDPDEVQRVRRKLNQVEDTLRRKSPSRK